MPGQRTAARVATPAAVANPGRDAASVRHVRLLAITAIAAASLALAGCSTNPSSITLTYEIDGASRTLNISPDRVRCDETNVSGISLKDGPVSFYDFRLINQSADGKIQVTVVEDGENDTKNAVQFNAETSAPNTGTEGVYLLKETSGTVTLIEDYDADKEYELSDLVETDATIAAELHCSAAE